jgi:hypothetical protein
MSIFIGKAGHALRPLHAHRNKNKSLEDLTNLGNGSNRSAVQEPTVRGGNLRPPFQDGGVLDWPEQAAGLESRESQTPEATRNLRSDEGMVGCAESRDWRLARRQDAVVFRFHPPLPAGQNLRPSAANSWDGNAKLSRLQITIASATTPGADAARCSDWIDRDAEGGWFTFELSTDGDLHDAFDWLARAYDAAGKVSKN